MKYYKQKTRTRSWILLTVLSVIITTGCVSSKPAVKVYPPRPERKVINIAPESEQDYAIILSYYEYLVEEWEIWGETVSAMIDE